MRRTMHTLLIPLAGIALLLTGCGGTTPEDSGRSNTTQYSQTPGPTAEAEDAVAEYVRCLHDHGLDNAVANPDGSIGYEFTEEDLGGDGVITSSSGDNSAIEETCRQAVPGYAPPDKNER